MSVSAARTTETGRTESAFTSRIMAALDWLSRRAWLLIAPLAVPALWPFLAYGLPRSSDGENHLLRLGLLDTAVRHGIFYPRWMPEMLLGFGYPRFGFYAPAGYYLVYGLHQLGFSLYTAFILGFVIGLLLAGFGMYFLAADIFGDKRRWAALVAATAYLYAPYLLVDTYIRGDFSEVLALGLFPWALWAARRILRSDDPGRYFIPFVLMVAGLALCHPLALMLTAPVLAGYMALHWFLSGRSARRGAWALAGLIGAMGVSAFYWLPVVADRSFLGAVGYDLARDVWLPGSAWRNNNFLDPGLIYAYQAAWPIVRFGFVQLTLAGAGVILARRRDAEWIYFIAVAAGTAFLGTHWALPLWQSSETLTAIQFTWRVLAVTSLPLALLAGGVVLPFRGSNLQIVPAALVIALIIVAQAPRLATKDVYAAGSVDLSPAVMAQWELERDALVGAEGNTTLQEFRPRWAGPTLEYDGVPAPAARDLTITLERGNALDLEMQLESAGGPLRFTTFYYPGWQVQTEAGPLQSYPSTNLGLLTVDLPPGAHALRVTWVGTASQRAAATVSLISLGAVALVAWFVARRRIQALIPLALLSVVVALVGSPPMEAIQTPARPVNTDGVQLLGYRAEQDDAYFYVYPYWLVRETLPDNWRTRWELREAAGRPVVELTSRAWYNTSPSSNWPAGTLADDAYRLSLPPDLPSGSYELAVSTDDGPATVVGAVTLETPARPARTPQHETDAIFGDVFRLDGYDLAGAQTMEEAPAARPGARAGDVLTYTLYWRADATPEESAHAFVHLVDAQGRPVAQEDHLPGPTFSPPRLWDAVAPRPDYYRLLIPADAPGGLYWPAVGMYDATLERLPAHAAAEAPPTDDFKLPPIKILAQPKRPAVKLTARFGDLATLTGYDLHLPEGGVRSGDALTVTVHLEALGNVGADYTRFLHLHDAGLGMAAQYDSPPQDGVNPTSSWLPGEHIADPITLQVRPDAQPGEYTLYLGFYDPQTVERLPAWLGNGDAAPDSRVPLGTIRVEP